MTKTKTLYTPLAMLLMLVLLGAAICTALIYKAKADIANGWSLADRIITTCEREDATAHSEDVVAILRSAGYQSVPGDGEFLYSPMCNIERYEDGSIVVWGADPEVPAYSYGVDH